MPKEKSVIFPAEMVKAILDGRKTQTRRVIKPQPPEGARPIFDVLDCYQGEGWAFQYSREVAPGIVHNAIFQLPCKGKALWNGDILYVRETHYRWTGCNSPPPSWMMIDDNPYNARAYLDSEEAEALYKGGAAVKVPAIHMPREIARLFLRVKNARVERLQDITEEDARAEGAPKRLWYAPYGKDESAHVDISGLPGWPDQRLSYRNGFATLWDRFNAKLGYGWEANPWVWVVEFEVVVASETAHDAKKKREGG